MSIRNKTVTTTLYIPTDLNDKLLEYMRKYHGSIYGRNSVIVMAIREFLERKLHTHQSANQNNNTNLETTSPVGEFRQGVDGCANTPT